MVRRSLLALLLLFVAASLRADPKVSFRKGVQSWESGNYAAAAANFQAAIDESSQETPRRDVLISGDRRFAYLPHYWLGSSLAKLGRCREAQQALSISESQGALQRSPNLFANVKQLRADCPVAPLVAEVRPVPVVPTTTTAESSTLPATTTGSSTIGVAPPLVPETVVVSSTSGSGPTSTAQVSGSPALADPRVASLRRSLQQQVARGEQLRRVTLDAPTAEWRRAQTGLEQALRAAAGAQSLTDTNQLTKIAADLTERTRLVTALIPQRQLPPPAAPPVELRRAVTAFFSGDYKSAVAALESARFTEARSVAQLHLIRGVARYSLYVSGGEISASLRDLARNDLKAFLENEPEGTLPLAESFSPRIRQELARIRKELTLLRGR